MIDVTEEHLEYLDNLRTDGIINLNMQGASPHVLIKFNVSTSDSKTIAHYWRATFDFRHRKKK